jgi:hypothetical protein
MSKSTRSVLQVAMMLAAIPEWNVPKPTVRRVLSPFGERGVSVFWVSDKGGMVEAFYSPGWMAVTCWPPGEPRNERTFARQADFVGVLRDRVATVFGKGDYP